MILNIIVFQDVTPCQLVEIYQTYYPTDEGCKFTKAHLVYFDHSKRRHTRHIDSYGNKDKHLNTTQTLETKRFLPFLHAKISREICSL